MRRIDLDLLKQHLVKITPQKDLFKLIKSELAKHGYIIRRRKVKLIPQKTNAEILAIAGVNNSIESADDLQTLRGVNSTSLQEENP